MTKSEKYILDHLRPITEYADTYFCSIYYTNKDMFIDSIFDKVSKWCKKNGGTIKQLSGKKQIGDRKGYIVKIVFPTYNKRDMKNVMAAIY